jgi:hypothetical protein
MLAVVWPLAIQAQVAPGDVGNAVLGMVYDEGQHGVRALKGTPGSALLDERIPSSDLALAAVSGPAGYAIAVEAESGTALLLVSGGTKPLPGVEAGARRIAVSPRGTSAVLYFPTTGKAQVVSGLPDRPVLMREVTLDSAPTVLAISDDAATLAAVFQDADEQVLYTSGAPMLRSRHITAVDFIPGRSGLLAATEGPTAVWLIQDAVAIPLLKGTDGIESPVGVAASGDGSRLFVAMRSGRVAVRNIEAGTLEFFTCSCEVTGLARLRGNAVFRLNDAATLPLWLLDADAAEIRITFVAAARRGEE